MVLGSVPRSTSDRAQPERLRRWLEALFSSAISRHARSREGVSIALSCKDEMSAVAKVLGLSDDQLRKELQGTSLTNVARARHVDPQLVSAALAHSTDARDPCRRGRP